MARAMMILTLMAFSTPAFAGDLAPNAKTAASAETAAAEDARATSGDQPAMEAQPRSAYLEGVQKKIRARQSARREKLERLNQKKPWRRRPCRARAS